jgi:hypothetical protein
MTLNLSRKLPIFLADRKDGLGERLRALTNAIICSKHFSGSFNFTWHPREGRMKEYNSIEDPQRLFDPVFLERHLLPSPLDVPDSEIIDIADYKPESFHYGAAKYVRVDQLPIYRIFPELEQFVKTGGFASCFHTILFSERINNHLKSICFSQLCSNSIAVHLRAGDIIYGIYSDSARFCSKAVPFQVAENIIEKYSLEGHKVLLLGQDDDLVLYLSEKYNCLVSSSFYEKHAMCSASRALADISLMARCKCIYSGSSGFAMLASSLANENRKQFIRISSESISSLLPIILADPGSNLIKSEQRIFSLRWIVGNAGFMIKTDKLLEICQKAINIAPDDLFFSLVAIFCYLDLGDRSSALALKDMVAAKNSRSSILRLLQPNQYGRKETASRILPSLEGYFLASL